MQVGLIIKLHKTICVSGLISRVGIILLDNS